MTRHLHMFLNHDRLMSEQVIIHYIPSFNMLIVLFLLYAAVIAQTPDIADQLGLLAICAVSMIQSRNLSTNVAHDNCSKDV